MATAEDRDVARDMLVQAVKDEMVKPDCYLSLAIRHAFQNYIRICDYGINTRT